MADETKGSQTRADRLDAILRRVAPKAVAYHQAHGKWPIAGEFDVAPQVRVAERAERILRDTPDADEAARAVATASAAAADATQRSAPYVITTLPAGGRKVVVSTDDGDVVSGVGPTIEDAIAALEAKLPKEDGQ